MIGPVEPDVFFRDYWEKQRLVLSRNRSDHYAGLMAASDVDALLYFGRPRFLEAQSLFASRTPTVLRGLPQELTAAGAGEFGLLDLHRLYAEGKTVLVHSVQLRVPTVAVLCRSIEAALHHPVNVNMYLTPPGAQGFAPHFDDHDVFIIQLEGYKHWRLYESARELPLKFEEPSVSREQLDGPVQEMRLDAGDLLYLPRGFVHEAFTSEVASLHLTVGIEVFRWADLLASAVSCVSRQDVALRTAVPVGWLGPAASSETMRERFQALLRLLAERAQIDEALAHLGEKFIGLLPALPDGRFIAQPYLERMDLDTLLEKRRGSTCQVIEEESSVFIRFPGGSVRGPSSVLRCYASWPLQTRHSRLGPYPASLATTPS